jgi:hypothetical protein
LAPGEDLPAAPSDEQVKKTAEALGTSFGERDTLPLEGE